MKQRIPPLDEFINESLNEGVPFFNDNMGSPTSTSKELLTIVMKALPRDLIDAVSEVEPNGISNMISPSTVSKKGVGIGTNDYKTITLIFDELYGKQKISSLTIGIRKGTSGPGTGYLAMSGTKKKNYVLMDDKQHQSCAIEFYSEEPWKQLKKLFDDEVAKYI